MGVLSPLQIGPLVLLEFPDVKVFAITSHFAKDQAKKFWPISKYRNFGLQVEKKFQVDCKHLASSVPSRFTVQSKYKVCVKDSLRIENRKLRKTVGKRQKYMWSFADD